MTPLPSASSGPVKLGALGQSAAGIEDIDQQIAIVLTTPPGSDPLRPEFACDLTSLIDLPAPMAAPLGARRIKDALTRWMAGQIKILAVDFRFSGGARDRATVDLEYEVVATGQISSREFRIRGLA